MGLVCRQCRDAVRELPAPANGQAVAGEPVVLALWRLALPAEGLSELTADHRRAIADGWGRPLGFCHLLLEEAWLAAQWWPQSAPVLHAAFGPLGGNGACLLVPREAHDLQARFHTYLAAAHRQAGHPGQASPPALAQRPLSLPPTRAPIRPG